MDGLPCVSSASFISVVETLIMFTFMYEKPGL
jgi:hypothetical protein